MVHSSTRPSEAVSEADADAPKHAGMSLAPDGSLVHTLDADGLGFDFDGKLRDVPCVSKGDMRVAADNFYYAERKRQKIQARVSANALRVLCWRDDADGLRSWLVKFGTPPPPCTRSELAVNLVNFALRASCFYDSPRCAQVALEYGASITTRPIVEGEEPATILCCKNHSTACLEVVINAPNKAFWRIEWRELLNEAVRSGSKSCAERVVAWVREHETRRDEGRPYSRSVEHDVLGAAERACIDNRPDTLEGLANATTGADLLHLSCCLGHHACVRAAAGGLQAHPALLNHALRRSIKQMGTTCHKSTTHGHAKAFLEAHALRAYPSFCARNTSLCKSLLRSSWWLTRAVLKERPFDVGSAAGFTHPVLANATNSLRHGRVFDSDLAPDTPPSVLQCASLILRATWTPEPCFEWSASAHPKFLRAARDRANAARVALLWRLRSVRYANGERLVLCNDVVERIVASCVGEDEPSRKAGMPRRSAFLHQEVHMAEVSELASSEEDEDEDDVGW